jgi:hypothetical protein
MESGDGGTMGCGVPLISEMESAWKNLLPDCDFPTDDKGGEVISYGFGFSSCSPLAWKNTAFF